MTVAARKRFSLKNRLKSFRYAFNGLILVFKTQHNFRIHSAVFFLVILAGIYFRITARDWCLVLLASGLVMGFELVNSAIEILVDLISPDYNEKAAMIKDLSAAAVLLSAIFAGFTGIFVFWKHFTPLLSYLHILN
jgi:diacylglycerol kinase